MFAPWWGGGFCALDLRDQGTGRAVWRLQDTVTKNPRRYQMNVDILLPILTFGTMGAVIVFALFSQQRTLKRLHDSNAPKSSLARRNPDPEFQPDTRETRTDIFPNR
jgi:hypothetical protein